MVEKYFEINLREYLSFSIRNQCEKSIFMDKNYSKYIFNIV